MKEKFLKTIEKNLRKTGEFEEENIKESAELIYDFMLAYKKTFDAMCKLPPLSKIYKLKDK